VDELKRKQKDLERKLAEKRKTQQADTDQRAVAH
jgi:hypothetical protein